MRNARTNPTHPGNYKISITEWAQKVVVQKCWNVQQNNRCQTSQNTDRYINNTTSQLFNQPRKYKTTPFHMGGYYYGYSSTFPYIEINRHTT